MRTNSFGSLITTLALAVTLGACSGDTGGTPAVEGTTTPSGSEAPAAAGDDIPEPEIGREPAHTAAPVPAEPAGAAEDHAESGSKPEPAATAAAATDPASIVHPSEILEARNLHAHPVGDSPGQSLFAEYFEEHPELKPDDPEADSVQRGRRLVGPIDRELELAFDTPEHVAETYLDAIFLESLELFDEIRVTEDEHAEIFWPEFPQSRPITNVEAGEAWFFHQAHCREGVMESPQ
ncbi:MAG TPA: hypothetical protein VKU85_00835, partial [bacterium]|nr:hypothetical protein [bacterium]